MSPRQLLRTSMSLAILLLVTVAASGCGPDYGHTDPSSAVSALREFQSMEGISKETKERILTHNPKELYAL